jgi:hypothetical protein
VLIEWRKIRHSLSILAKGAFMKRIIVILVLLAALMGLNSCGLFTGTIHYDNWSGYGINCYLDSAYVGYMSAMGSYWEYNVSVGAHTLYAVSSGGTVYWGPTAINLTTDGFDWNLY